MLNRKSLTHHLIEPPAGRLGLSSRRPQVTVSDVERKNKMNREAVARHRQRQEDPLNTNARARTGHNNRTSNSRTVRRRLQARDRMRQLRERAKKNRRDPLSYFYVPLPGSVIHQLAADLKVEAGDDEPIDDRTWRRLVGLVIAKVVKSAVNKKP